MPNEIPTFTPKNSALLLIDHQTGTMQLIKNMPLAVVKRNALALAKVAKILNMPVVLTSSQEEMFQGPLLPELADIVPDTFAARIKRAGIVNAWDDKNFVTAVEKTGRKNLVMAGVTTDICLVFPAISAVRAGYSVQAVMDASGSPFELSEEMARRRMEGEGVVLTAANTVIAELTGDWSLPVAAKVSEVLFADVMGEVRRNTADNQIIE
jgi:nicotinamidase-related amidase